MRTLLADASGWCCTVRLTCAIIIISGAFSSNLVSARDPDPAVEAGILRLESRGAIVKPFRVAELDIEGTVVRLGDENDGRLITAAGKIDPAVIADLKAIPKLLLEIRGPSFADDGLAGVAPLTNLVGLDVAGTKVTGRGLSIIGKLKSLRMLDLSFDKIDGESLDELSPLTNLEFLSLIDTQLDDSAVQSLCRLRSLRSLQMLGTNLSPLGRSAVTQKLPKADIAWPKLER